MIEPVIETLRHSRKPLLVSDIDEVVLDFLDPFQDYLQSENHWLNATSFRLNGNILSTVDDAPASPEMVDNFQERFFEGQDRWQRPSPGAHHALNLIARHADIVFLTAMPPRHSAVRRQLLDRHALHFPMIATEEAKGPVVRDLIGGRGVPAAFIDDIFYNLHSVRENAPECLLVNLMSNATFRALAPEPGHGIEKAENWQQAATMILDHFGVDVHL